MRRGAPTNAGMTLIELLVVVSIVVLLVATSVPLMKPALQEGKIREGSRQLSVFIQVARARAVESGRAAGIWIERNAPGSNAGFQVYLAESPLPYQGDIIGARATHFVAARSMIANHRDVEFNDNNKSQTLPFIVQPGDVIKFDYKGHFYPIVAVSPDSMPAYVEVDVSQHALPPNPNNALPYQIFRRPKKSLAMPLQLSGNTVVDLEYSGVGSTASFDGMGNELSGREFRASSATDTTPVLVVFNSSGSVDHIAFAGTTTAPAGAIHLLIARNEQVGIPADTTPNPIPVSATVTGTTHQYTQNVADLSSVWVTIQPRNGTVSSAENGWVLDPPANPNFVDSFRFAREYGQSGQAMGGR